MAKASKNPYEVLGLSAFCSEKEAKSRYRDLSKLYHPDNLETGDISKFREVSEAWKELQLYGFYEDTGSKWTHSTLFKIISIWR
jgi:curved DNA-binding protein CbpA